MGTGGTEVIITGEATMTGTEGIMTDAGAITTGIDDIITRGTITRILYTPLPRLSYILRPRRPA